MSLTSDSHQSAPLRLAILILAAGEGARLGGYPKALLKKSGHTLLKHFLHSIRRLSPVETLLVTGFYSDKIEAEVRLLKQSLQIPIACVHNQNPEKGQASSVRLGIESLTSDYDVLLIALCDQPNIGTKEIESLLEQFKHRALGQEIVLPIINNQRGNPVLFSRGVIKRILEIPEMVCRPYMDLHPELVQALVTSNEAYVLDVDTLNDIQKLGLDPIET